MNITPEDLRTEYYPHLDSSDMQDALKSLNIKSTEFCFGNSYLNEEYISEWLQSGRPVLICIGNDKENIWTTASHYMVLLDIDDDTGKIYISNPNGLDNTEKASNWYEMNEVLPHIVKALFIESF